MSVLRLKKVTEIAENYLLSDLFIKIKISEAFWRFFGNGDLIVIEKYPIRIR